MGRSTHDVRPWYDGTSVIVWMGVLGFLVGFWVPVVSLVRLVLP